MTSSQTTAPSTIIYTHTDEAPALATYSLLPIVQAFAGAAGVSVGVRDISLAGRILAQFPDFLTPEQRVNDDLAELGAADAAARGQHHQAAQHLGLDTRSSTQPSPSCSRKGYALPDYPDDPADDAERDIKARYDKVKGSAVNPVLREGNSDRRAPEGGQGVRPQPSALDGCVVARLEDPRGDDGRPRLPLTTSSRSRWPPPTSCASSWSRPTATSRCSSRRSRCRRARSSTARSCRSGRCATSSPPRSPTPAHQGVLFSVHLKATMMKVSDPILFGHAVRAYFAPVFEKLRRRARSRRRRSRQRLGQRARRDRRAARRPARRRSRRRSPRRRRRRRRLAMVDSDRGITNLHVPSDIIVDASMPAMIRQSGQMWNAAGDTQDCKAVIPDSSYAGIYQAVIDDCKANGAYDPATMGSVPNVGLMAQAAEEYGSHDKTFEIPADGTVRVVDQSGDVLMEFAVDRATCGACATCATSPIQDWVKLAVGRARATGAPAVFWLDADRAHDAPADRQGRAVPRRSRHERARDPHHVAGRGHQVLGRAHPPGPRHDLGHRQRAARLQHRPVPDPRARHQRQDALDRAADERRRAVRDRRRRLGAEARAAVPEGELPAVGLARRVPGAGGVVRALRRRHRQPRAQGAGRHARRRHRPPARREQVTGPQARARSTTAAATAFLAMAWAEALANADRRRRAGGTLRAHRRGAVEQLRRRSTRSCSTIRATPTTSAATTAPTRTKAAAAMRPSETFN